MGNIKIAHREDKVVWTGIKLVLDRDQWTAVVNTVMNLRGVMKCWGTRE
jgi:hypothetical protein